MFALTASSVGIALVACAPAAPAPQINAKIVQVGSEFIIQNNDAFDWTNCKIDVNSGNFGGGGYKLAVQAIRPGESKIIDTSNMANDSGERFNPVTHIVQKIVVTCETPNGTQFTGRNI
jgi:hypothetical protein